jgi:hypothetical protein
MADEHTNKKSGFHIGNVGGNVKITAGGDIVGGDKTTTTIQKGFAADEQRQQFQAQIDQLREALRAVKAKIEASPSLSVDQKEEAAGEILQHVKALKEVKEKTAEVSVGKQAPPEVVSVVESTLERASGVIERLQGIAKKTVGVAETVGEFAVKYGPLIASARHLFGLP